MDTSTWIILGVIVVLVIWVISIYNGLVGMRQRVNQSFADVDVQLRQRHDLIPNLVETVKGYAAHERGTLDDVIKVALIVGLFFLVYVMTYAGALLAEALSADSTMPLDELLRRACIDLLYAFPFVTL